jgi:hypothetical protein
MTTIRHFRYIFLTVLVLLSVEGESQVKDACLWSSVEMKISPIKNWKIITCFGYRLNENLTETESIFVETGIQYKLNDYFRISGEYRFMKKNIRLDNYYATRHRYTGEFKTEFPFRQFEIDIALKYQLNQYDAIEHDWGNTKIISRNRDKITLSYKFDKIRLKPFIFHEVFIPLFSTSDYTIDSQRTGGGIEYSIQKKHSLKVMYFVESEKSNSSRYLNYITFLGYGYNFK